MLMDSSTTATSSGTMFVFCVRNDRIDWLWLSGLISSDYSDIPSPSAEGEFKVPMLLVMVFDMFNRDVVTDVLSF